MREQSASRRNRDRSSRSGDSHQVEIRAAGEKIGAARGAMRALLDADQIDESAIRAKSVDVAAAEADAAIIQAKVRQEIFGILPAEQLQKAKENGPRQRRLQQ